MTKKQADFFKVQRSQSELRSRLSEIRATAESDMTPELRAEQTTLEGRFHSGETQFRELLDAVEGEQAAGASTDAEARALRHLTRESNVGDVFSAVAEQGKTEGATKELQEHFKVGAHSVPLELLRAEHRAVTPAPTDTGVEQAEPVQPVFALGDTAFLNVPMPTVASGDAIFPVLGTRPTVGVHTDSTPVTETTGSFSAVALPPSALRASFFYLRSDAARFRGMGDALREALSSGLSEALDAQVQTAIVADVTRTNRTSISDYAHYKSLVTGRVDGRFATSEGDVRVLMGSGTFVHANTVYKSTESDESSVDAMRRLSGALRVSAHVAAVSNASKQDVILRRGARMDAVAPLWAGVDLDSAVITDPFTKASTGEIVITANLLAAFKVIRAGGFARLQTQHA